MPRMPFRQRWWGPSPHITRRVQYKSPYKAGKNPGMNAEQTEAYLAAHPWPPIDTTPDEYLANETWRRSVPNKTKRLYYPDGDTVRLMDEFEELHKAKK